MNQDRFRNLLLKGQQLKLLLAGIALLLMVLIGFANVVCRNLWQPLKGSFEIIGYLGAVTVALSLGSAQLEKKHIIVDIITRHYTPGWGRLTSAIGHLCSALFFILAAWQTWAWADNIRLTGETSETLHLIFYPFIYLTAFGFAFLALVLLSDLSRSLKNQKAHPPSRHES
ncbi:MAG: TRAP transporter small permease [Deltaproteobacteria bacterium]|nr:TRAP transporter small permease [Deltaproteobacteria bacterium]